MNKQSSNLNEQNLKDILSKLSREISIKKWDLGASISSDISVQIDKGQPKQLKAGQRNTVTLRVWNTNNIVGTSTTSDLSEKGLKAALSTALEASHFGNSDQSPEFSSLSKASLPKLIRPIRKSEGIKYLINQLIEAEQKLLSSHRAIKSVPYNGLSQGSAERIYINSEGALRKMKFSQASLYLFARTEEENRKPRSSGSIRLGYGVQDIDIKSCIEEAAEKTISHLNYMPIVTGKYLVCFAPEPFLDLISAFSNIYNARSIIDGISLSNKDSIGNTISSDLLSLDDDGLHKGNLGGCTFDGEGTPTQKISIIKSGKLTNFIHSEATARMFGVKPTGHAGNGSKVPVSPDWPVVFKTKGSIGKHPELDHINTNHEFVLIDNLHALHSGIKATQGSFSIPFDGWIIKNGEKISIESATISGDILNLLKNIVQIEDKEVITHQGVSPHIWIEELSITGEG